MPLPTSHIARLLNDEAERAFFAAHAAYWAAWVGYQRPGLEAPPAAAGTLDELVERSRGEAANAMREQQLRAAAAEADETRSVAAARPL